MKKTSKKPKTPLHLSAETVRKLDPAQLVAVAGGQDYDRKAGGSKACE